MKLKKILVVLTFICGCATTEITPSSKVEIKKEPKQTLQQLAPLFSEGTKPLLLIDQEDLLQDPNGYISPCVDPNTGEEEKFLLADLKSERVNLSYASMERIVSSLQIMGVQAIVAAEPKGAPYTVDSRGKATYLPTPPGTVTELTKKYTCSELPIFYKPKPTPEKTLSNVLDGPSMRGSFNTGSKFAFVDMPSTDFGLNESLIAFYHPEGRKRLDRVEETIRETFDVAPVQVYLESMVLEVNESGIKELGVLYKNNAPTGSQGDATRTLEIGALSPSSPQTQRGSTSTNFFTGVLEAGAGVSSVADLLSLQINALIAKGSAEVLSRPSVTALHNHPAIIEVTEQKQFPLRTSFPCAPTPCTPAVSFSFDEVTPGILLQIRPKISKSNNEVTMEIDVQVKALVSANDGIALNDDASATLATKPGSSTRRVHTFAIVPNKTPIIIGGLVSKDKEETTNKIPWLADIPYLGKLFGSEQKYDEKKELIVVITPHIVYDNTAVGIQNPKDTAMFDDSNMVLFRDSYRVRSEDVFDLGFVYKTEQFRKYRDYVVNRSARDRQFAKTKLAKIYSGKQFPAGDVLVTRMIYDIVGKRKLEKAVSIDKIIITEQAGDGKFKDVAFLEKEWKKAESMSAAVNAIGQGQKDYGLELKFSTNKSNSSDKPYVAIRVLPKAEISILQQIQKVDENPHRIFIASKKDLQKIRKAVIVREIRKLNDNTNIFGSLNQFRNGIKIILPVVKKTRYFLLDLEVARAYHHIKYYYPILEQSLQKSFQSIEKEIEKNNKKVAKGPKDKKLKKKKLANPPV
jgi:general secretion pathway protein D